MKVDSTLLFCTEGSTSHIHEVDFLEWASIHKNLLKIFKCIFWCVPCLSTTLFRNKFRKYGNNKPTIQLLSPQHTY